jgi:hypothetical protein
LVLAVLLSACGGNAVTQSYKTLYIASQAYDTGMKSVAALQAQGKITLEQRAVINQYASPVYGAIQTADMALSTYNKTQMAADKDKLLTAITDITKKWPVLVNNVDRIVPGTFKPLEVPK